MIELSPAEFGTVKPLFAKIDHNIPLVYSVLDGMNPGRVFVDRRNAPTCAFLFPQGTYFFVDGDVTNDAFCRALPGLIFDQILPDAEEQELILFSFSDAWRARLDELLTPRGVIRIYRKIFRFDPQAFAVHQDWRKHIPDGYYMKEVDASLVEQDPDLGRVLEAGTGRFGCALMHGDKLVSSCVSVFVGGGEAEIDIHTAGDYQGRGLALLTASAFIEACQQRGLRPNWSCWPERAGSVALAKKLGFVAQPDVPVHFWAADM